MQCKDIPPLLHPHPGSDFLDDNRYHGDWQDWTLSAAYHTNLGNYLLTPSFNVYIPSHNYTFFANAAVGQHIWKLEPALELAHQFDFTNIYYQVRYGCVFTKHTLGHSVAHHHFDLELGYFFNEKLSARAFMVGKWGHGIDSDELFNHLSNGQDEYFYQHDRLLKHNLIGGGVGLDYRLGNRYTVSASVQRLVKAEDVFNFKYAAEVRLAREF